MKTQLFLSLAAVFAIAFAFRVLRRRNNEKNRRTLNPLCYRDVDR